MRKGMVINMGMCVTDKKTRNVILMRISAGLGALLLALQPAASLSAFAKSGLEEPLNNGLSYEIGTVDFLDEGYVRIAFNQRNDKNDTIDSLWLDLDVSGLPAVNDWNGMREYGDVSEFDPAPGTQYYQDVYVSADIFYDEPTSDYYEYRGSGYATFYEYMIDYHRNKWTDYCGEHAADVARENEHNEVRQTEAAGHTGPTTLSTIEAIELAKSLGYKPADTGKMIRDIVLRTET